MSRTLDVYFLGVLAGKLHQDSSGVLGFQYDAAWLERSDAIALSQSLPRQSEPFGANVCHGFFGGILPEEAKRDLIAKNLGISKKNDFAMLAEIGGECAGAISFLPEGQNPGVEATQYLPLSETDLAAILKDLPKRPLMAGEEGIRLSLAGAQDKITVYYSKDGFAVPLNGAPSTHILKPAIEHYADTVLNEYLCLKLAGAIGLPVADADILKIGNMQVLSVRRYDRVLHKDDSVERLHQEDFCQSLGIPSEMKYQSEGGVSLKQAFDLLRSVSTVPVLDLQIMLDAVIFNYLIGNHDAHGKNFSLLYREGTTRLAPLYDILSTAYYPELSRKMAMKISSKYKPEDVFPRHFAQLAGDTGLTRSMVLKRVPYLADKILHELATMDVAEAQKLSAFIQGRIAGIKGRFAKYCV